MSARDSPNLRRCNNFVYCHSVFIMFGTYVSHICCGKFATGRCIVRVSSRSMAKIVIK